MMSIRLSKGAQPPIGFIVEGGAEHAAYPSLVARICRAPGLKVPVVNARGFGGVISNLEEHLDDLVSAHHPRTVVITVDYRDLVRHGHFSECSEIVESLAGKAEEWKRLRKSREEFSPLPVTLCTIVQIQQFESWLLSDPQGLLATAMIHASEDDCCWKDADKEVPNPASWIRRHRKGAINTKSPGLVASIVRNLEPGRMRTMSRSFDKFFREVEKAYGSWMTDIDTESP